MTGGRKKKSKLGKQTHRQRGNRKEGDGSRRTDMFAQKAKSFSGLESEA